MEDPASALLDRVAAIAAGLRDRPGALLPVLHAVQDALGFVPPDAVPVIARVLNLSRADVQGTLTFYHHFRTAPPGRHVLRLCRAEACQALHGEALADHARRRLGVDFGGTTADGGASLEPVYCLGNCACAPAAQLDGHLHGRLTPARLDALLDAAGVKR